MAQFIEIPPARVPRETLRNLLQEFASRDGTDYGERELSLADKERELRRQMNDGALMLLYDTETETWDLLDSDQARSLLDAELSA